MDKKKLKRMIVMEGLIISGILMIFSVLSFAESKVTTDVLKADLDKDGIVEEISFIKKPVEGLGSLSDGTLRVKTKDNTFSKELGPIEFSDGASLGIINVVSGIKPYIGIFAYTGGHSMTLTLFSFDGKGIKEEIDILSDDRSIKVNDNDIVAINIDYDNDPINDTYIMTYRLVDNKWKLVSVYRTKTKQMEDLKKWSMSS